MIRNVNIRYLVNLLNHTLFLFLLVLLVFSCKPEVHPNIYGDNQAVVYCVYGIEPLETRMMERFSRLTNVVRLQRSFNGGTDNFQSAMTNDSNYFHNPNVHIEYCLQGNIIKTIRFIRTNEFEKDIGLFSFSSNFVYKNTMHVVPRFFDTIRLVIDIPEENLLITSSAPYISSTNIIIGPLSEIVELSMSEKPFSITFYDEGYYYEVDLVMNYEAIYGNGELKKKSIKWKKSYHSRNETKPPDWINFYNNIYQGYEYVNNPDWIKKRRKTFIYNSDDFFKFVGKSIIPNDSVVSRRFIGIDILIKSTSQSFKDYIDFYNIKGDYGNILTNINNGIGFFASLCTSSLKNLELSKLSHQRLMSDNYTYHLNFEPQ